MAPLVPTTGMRFGTCVHNYLLEPATYDGEFRKEVKACAAVLKPYLANMKYMAEVAVTANFHHDGYVMPVRGRIDILIPGMLIIDLKVSKMPLVKAVQHFRYDHQIGSGYANMAGVPRALIISINPLTLKPSILEMPNKTDWWEYMILQRGTRIS
jgi:hypothetical protein